TERLSEAVMRTSPFNLGGISLGVIGTVGVLMLIPGGNSDSQPRQAALAASPELTRFLDDAVDTTPAAKTSAEVVAEVAAGPEPGQPVATVRPVAVPATPAPALTAATELAAPLPAGDKVAAHTAVNMRSGPSTSYD